MGKKSELEEELRKQLELAKLPGPEREYRFHPIRRWRFDFAYPDRLIAIECEGGTYTRGRHVRAYGFEKDCEKYNAAAILGWKVLRFTSKMIRSGMALSTIEEALEDGQKAT